MSALTRPPRPPVAPAVCDPSADGYSRARRGHRRVVAGLIAIGLILVFLAGYVFHYVMFAGIGSGPTFIEELRSERVRTADIATVRVLKFDPGAGWPFTEEDYASKAQSTLAPGSVVAELIAILKEHTTDGRVSRNHPEGLYYGILGIDLVDGRRYWLFYEVGWYQGSYYVSLTSSAAGTTNPNGGKRYENTALARFLEAHDPWFHGKGSPGTRYRVNSPDDVP